MRGAWIEILAALQINQMGKLSLPVRGAWIEIEKPAGLKAFTTVAPRAGSVD